MNFVILFQLGFQAFFIAIIVIFIGVHREGSTRKLRWSMGRTRIKVPSSISEVILLESRDLWNGPSSQLGAKRSLAGLAILQSL